MLYLVSYLLEPISHFILFAALFYWAGKDKRGIIKILSGYYFLAGLLILKATLLLDKNGTNIQSYSQLCMLTAFGLGAYFYNVLQLRWQKIIVLLMCFVNGIYYLFQNVVQPGLTVFDSLAYVILSATIVIMIFMFMHQLLSQVKEEPLAMSFDFWFVASQLIYFLGAFAIFLMYGYMTAKIISNDVLPNGKAAMMWLWGVHNVLLFLSALLTTGGIAWISSRKKLP